MFPPLHSVIASTREEETTKSNVAQAPNALPPNFLTRGRVITAMYHRGSRHIRIISLAAEVHSSANTDDPLETDADSRCLFAAIRKWPLETVVLYHSLPINRIINQSPLMADVN